MRYSAFWVLFFFIFAPAALPREEKVACGTRPGRWKEELFLHRQQAKRVLALKRMGAAATAAEAPRADRDAGNIAILEDSGGVVSRRNDFNLSRRTLAFQPAAGAARYTYTVPGASYDDAAAAAGTPLAGLADDDFRAVPLPFAFPFFGATYREIYVNSDGNLTFTAGDGSSLARSLARLNVGPPRLAPLYQDLDPSVGSGAVRVLSEAGRFVVSWVEVPEFRELGVGPLQTFQARLYPDGRIEFAWSSIATSGAVVGITPGGSKGQTALVSFATEPSGEYSSTVAERFGGTLELDITAAAQRFYETHEDAYDYLVFFNDMGIAAESSAVAWESTVRNSRTGYGDERFDVGREFGSAARLQAVMNMGPLSQYPGSPDALVPARGSIGDTPLSVIAHEAGHLFLAYASVRDPEDPLARPMLGFQDAHWFFGFNSEASLLEGNRIVDRGPSAVPRFLTTGTVAGFSPLDQYLMGLRGPHEVEAEHQMFFVTGTPASFSRRQPLSGVGFDGERRDVRLDEIVAVEGRRTPDHTVAQRRFRFAFILITRAGTEPRQEDLAKLEGFRTAFEAYFNRATSGRAIADTSLKRNLRLSLFPAAGVLAGRTMEAVVSVDTAPAAPLRVALERKTGVTEMPAVTTIAAGAKSAVFTVRGLRPGVEELLALPDDPAYQPADARVQVSAPEDVRVAAVSGDRQAPGAALEPVVVRLTDVNNLPYPGVPLRAAASDGSAVAEAVAVTGEDGRASFRWTPGAAPVNELRIGLEGAAPSLTVRAGARAVTALAVVNAATFAPRISPGALASLFGHNLAGGAREQGSSPWPRALGGVTVLVNGRPAPVVFVSDGQVNFQVPADLVDGEAEVAVTNAAGSSAPLRVGVAPLAPGLFGALVSGTGQTTAARPARRGEYLEVYATGLGPVRPREDGLHHTTLAVQGTVAGVPTSVIFSGMTGFDGLYQVNVRVPDGVASGPQPLVLTAGGVRSNELSVRVE